jgi:iron-sulfur cluster insertion protein
MRYGFDLEEFSNEDDFSFELKGVNLLIDGMSMSYLNGAEVDYKEDLIGSSFSINNPNAETSCGCGSSFSV